ncbi:MAG: three-Cys-motif partner protein TcmP [Kiloniellales bacterium]
MGQEFFEERLEQSEAKARIVTKYFLAWAKVVMPMARKRGGKIGSIDLYAGPGRYKDGSPSTPLLVLEEAINDNEISQMLVSYFNDAEPSNTITLKDEINKLHDIDKLRIYPVVHRGDVDNEAAQLFYQVRGIPTFTFIDPFGYKGLSLNIIKSVIRDWGCDCIFFFNYNRINPGLSNDFVTKHMNALFSKERADKLRRILPGVASNLRESTILEELAAEIKSLGGQFVLPFTFKNQTGNRTSHMLIFVSKSFKGYEIMKDIMAKESSTNDEGVASFQYSPADASMPLLFSLSQPLSKLKDDLLKQYSDQKISVNRIYREHSVGKPYVRKNYTEVIRELERDGVVTANSVTGNRKKFTYPDHVLIEFPKGGPDGDELID